jgi:Uma2 family endonuclease
MGYPAARRATYEDLLALPENVVGEIIGGQLVTQPRPASRHSLAASHLGGILYNPFVRGKGGPGGWVVLDEPEVHLKDGNIVVPDLAGWHRERMPEVPDVAAFELVPDWICEVLSPGTAVTDRSRKMPLYVAVTVPHVWLVDPGSRTLEAYKLEAGGWHVVGMWGEDAVVRVEPFEAIEFELGALWG